MPATGNNIMQQDRILSIRLSPDGLSFWTTGLVRATAQDSPVKRDLWDVSSEKEFTFDSEKSAEHNLSEALRFIRETAGECKMAEVYIDTLRTVPVPAEFASDNTLDKLLADNNIVLKDTEDAVYTVVSPGINAVMVYERRVVDILRDSFGDLVIASPFGLNNAVVDKYGAGRRRTAALYLTPGHVYITVFEGKSGAWLYSDVMKWSVPADILYYMSVLDQNFGLRKGKIYVRGTGTSEVCPLLQKYFRKTRCE